ncbi:MAG: hypothetical protein U0Q16_25750 [Bryobacteraceae bacterium]
MRLQTAAGIPCQIAEFLGDGKQGEVYRARLGSSQVAVKWYKPSHATHWQRKVLEHLIDIGEPKGGKFLWPLHLVGIPGQAEFGFAMRLRDPAFRGLHRLVDRDLGGGQRIGFRALAGLGYQLADQFQLLHSHGLCYRDISLDNVCFNATTQDLLVADCDNIAAKDAAGIKISGTPKFIAPELILGNARPSADTDLYSLAVLLFYVLMNHHPLEGGLELQIPAPTEETDRALYGEKPVFIFDPVNQTNRPDPVHQPNAHTFWWMYPELVRARFTRAFTEGIRDPVNGRVPTTYWRRDMIQLRDLIVDCADHKCRRENVFDPDAASWKGGKACWRCDKRIGYPFWLRVRHPDYDRRVVLNPGTQLFPHHLQRGADYDFGAPEAAVTQKEGEPEKYGLKNLSSKTWVSVLDGIRRPVLPEHTVRLVKGLRLNFHGVEGEVAG